MPSRLGEAPGWAALHASYEAKRINHSIAFEEACTNRAESYFSRLRRSEIGVHRRIGHHLGQYAAEMRGARTTGGSRMGRRT